MEKPRYRVRAGRSFLPAASASATSLVPAAAPPAYDAAGSGPRISGWRATPGSANLIVHSLGETLRARARDMVRKNPFAEETFDKYVSNAIGTGIRPAPLHPEGGQRQAIREAWARWADEADADGVTNFYGLQALAVRSMVEGGDCFARLRARLPEDGLSVPLQVQLLEAEMVPLAKTERLAGDLLRHFLRAVAAGVRPMSGLTSYGDIEARFDDAMNDSQVRAVVLDIDSPGGEASGVFDVADRIHAARGTKPIWAVADEMAFSAAYALASAADRVIVPRTGAVGSIGVLAMHLDVSAFDKAAGFKFTTIYAGARKNDFNPHEPLSGEAAQILQDSVDRTYALFVQTVAQNRGLKAEAVRGTEAGIFEGLEGQATAARLADAVMPFREALAELTDRVERNRGPSMLRAGSAAHPGTGPKEKWDGRLPPLMLVGRRVEVDPHGPTASKCQEGRASSSQANRRVRDED